MQTICNFILANLEEPYLIPNGPTASSGNTLSVTYSFTGKPASSLLSIMGNIDSTGDTAVLDSYDGNVDTERTVNLAATYDSFSVVGSWDGGLNVTISGFVVVS